VEGCSPIYMTTIRVITLHCTTQHTVHKSIISTDSGGALSGRVSHVTRTWWLLRHCVYESGPPT